jgi:hypothetical protein
VLVCACREGRPGREELGLPLGGVEPQVAHRFRAGMHSHSSGIASDGVHDRQQTGEGRARALIAPRPRVGRKPAVSQDITVSTGSRPKVAVSPSSWASTGVVTKTLQPALSPVVLARSTAGHVSAKRAAPVHLMDLAGASVPRSPAMPLHYCGTHVNRAGRASQAKSAPVLGSEPFDHAEFFIDSR